MSGRSTIDTLIGGAPWRLHAWRGALHLDSGVLLVADVHLGKAAHFRRAGLPLPQGTTSADLERLARLVDALAPKRLLVLGDLVHAGIDTGAAWLARWQAFRRDHAALDIAVVGGNHDRGAELRLLGVDDLGDVETLDGVALVHHPRAAAHGHVVAGHLHPVVRLRDRGLSTRLPAFWSSPTVMVLPAFGAFTGGHEFLPDAGDQVFACAGDSIVQLPPLGVAAMRER